MQHCTSQHYIWQIYYQIIKLQNDVTTQTLCILLLHTRGSAMAEGPRDVVVSRNSVTTKHPI